jgi:invasion protein IalB
MIARSMQIIAFATLAASFSESALGQAAGAPSSYVGPAIDRDAFREGEVRRLEGSFQNWRVVCDEVPRLRQRFCSMFGEGRDQDGRSAATIVVTTSEEGRPAAVLRLPHGLALQRGVQILAAQSSSKDKMPAASKQETKLAVVDCGVGGCMTLWPLSATEIGALNKGGSLRVRFWSIRPTTNLWSIERLERLFVPVELVVAGAGFADGVKASLASGVAH